MSDAKIVVEKDAAIGWIRINRPERLNAFAGTMRTDLLHALQELEQDADVAASSSRASAVRSRRAATSP
jgi:enoyl-CoA hydratase/carnithine racemase